MMDGVGGKMTAFIASHLDYRLRTECLNRCVRSLRGVVDRVYISQSVHKHEHGHEHHPDPTDETSSGRVPEWAATWTPPSNEDGFVQMTRRPLAAQVMQFQHLKYLCEELGTTLPSSHPILLVDDDDVVMSAPTLYPCIGFGVVYTHNKTLADPKKSTSEWECERRRHNLQVQQQSGMGDECVVDAAEVLTPDPKTTDMLLDHPGSHNKEGDVIVRADLSGSVVPFGFLCAYLARFAHEDITPVQDMDFKQHMVAQLGLFNPLASVDATPHMLYRHQWRMDLWNSWPGHMVQLGLTLPPWTNLFAKTGSLDPKNEP